MRGASQAGETQRHREREDRDHDSRRRTFVLRLTRTQTAIDQTRRLSKIRKAFCVLSRSFGYAAKRCSDFLCFNDANCFPINIEQIIGFALLRSMSPGRNLMLCAKILLTIGVAPPAK
jgi:hypothetical protein